MSFGPDVRRGAADWQGEGETVGGIVVMRYGMNALNVIDGVKAKLKEIAPSLPAGVEIVTGYDRSWLINQSIHTLKRDLVRRSHHRQLRQHRFLCSTSAPRSCPSSRCPSPCWRRSSRCTTCTSARTSCRWADWRWPSACSSTPPSSWSKTATAIWPSATMCRDEAERRRILVGAAQQVGPALFYSLIIIVVSFLPVFLLEAQEGRMFRPLAWTKTLALIFSSLLSITLVPALMPFCLRGKLRPESKNPAARITQAIYLPVLRWCLRHWKLVIALNLAFSWPRRFLFTSVSAASSCRRCMKAPRSTCRARCRASRSRRPSR